MDVNGIVKRSAFEGGIEDIPPLDEGKPVLRMGGALNPASHGVIFVFWIFSIHRAPLSTMVSFSLSFLNERLSIEIASNFHVSNDEFSRKKFESRGFSGRLGRTTNSN